MFPFLFPDFLPFLFTPLARRPFRRVSTLRLRHSLGCCSTLVPWAERAPLQPLSSPQPAPASWYSGLCPCLPGTVSFLFLSAAFLPHAQWAQGLLKAMHEMLWKVKKIQVSSAGSYKPRRSLVRLKLLNAKQNCRLGLSCPSLRCSSVFAVPVVVQGDE